jgi:hypothetical protein
MIRYEKGTTSLSQSSNLKSALNCSDHNCRWKPILPCARNFPGRKGFTQNFSGASPALAAAGGDIQLAA